MRYLTALLVLTLSCIARAGDQAIALNSPSKNITATVAVANGHLCYSIEADGKAVIESSPIGISVDGVDLGKDAVLGTATSVPVEQSYTEFYRHRTATDHSIQSSIPITTPRAKGQTAWKLDVRCFDDGVAIRYELPAGAKHVDGESTSWAIPSRATQIVWSDNSECYEGFTHATAIGEVPEQKIVLAPLTITLPEHFISISEADCEAFPDMGITRQGNVLQAMYAQQAKGFDLVRDPTEAKEGIPCNGLDTGNVVTPWRTVIVSRDLNGIVNSDMLTDLCPAPRGDFGWVQPGRVLWQWWSTGGPRLDEQHAWYDAAAKLKWEYYLIDEGWSRWKTPDKDAWQLLKDCIDYGKSVGVKTLVWKNSNEVLTAEKRRAFMEKVASLGAAGLKIDFIPPATSQRMQWYLGGMQDAAELHLILNYHGSVKPTGIERTYPNALTREAVRGDEYHLTRYHRVMPLTQDVELPFARLLAGAGDTTPVMLNPKELKTSGFTWPHELAQGIVQSEPLLCFADQYKFFIGSPFEDLMRDYPCVWDETRVLPVTQIGQVVAFARRSGDSWWLAVENGPQQRTLNLPLDFLPSTADGTLLYDAADDAAVDHREQKVSPGDTLMIPLRPAGGFFARLRIR
jgi:alpha-glucosidase